MNLRERGEGYMRGGVEGGKEREKCHNLIIISKFFTKNKKSR